MPKLVEIPDVGVVEFPDDMADEDISSSIETDILPNYAKQEPPATSDATAPSAENSSSMRPSYASALADTLQKNKLFGSATSALGQAADKTIKRKPDGDWDLPLLKQDNDNAFVQAAGGLATLGGQKLGARLDSAGMGTDQKAIQKVFHDFQQANNLSDEEVTSTWQDLGNLSRGWDEGEKLRVLSNGSIIPNPTDSDWLDSEKASTMVRNAQAPEAAKSSLLRNLPQIQTNLAADKLGEYEAGGELSNMATGAMRPVVGKTITPSEWAKQQGREDLGSPKFVQDYEAYLQTTPEWKRNVSGLAGRTALGWSKVANTALGIAGLLGSDSAGQLAAEGTEAGNMARSGMEPTGLAGTIAEEVPSVVAQIFGTRLLGAGASALTPSLAGSATTLGTYGLAGLQSAGLTYADELAQGTPEEEAREKAVRSGISTSLITAAFGQGSLGGVERVAAGNLARGITVRELLTTAKDQGIKNLLLSPGLREFGRGVLKASAGEATEEGVDQLLQSFLTADPDTNLANAWDEALQAGMVGGIIGGAADVAQRITQEDRAALNLAMEALPDAPKAAAAAMEPVEASDTKSTEKPVETGIADNSVVSQKEGEDAQQTVLSPLDAQQTEIAPTTSDENPLPQQPPLEIPSGDPEVPVEEVVAPGSSQAAEAPLEPSPVPTGIEPTESLPEGTTSSAATGDVGASAEPPTPNEPNPQGSTTGQEVPQAPLQVRPVPAGPGGQAQPVVDRSGTVVAPTAEEATQGQIEPQTNGQDTQRQPGPQGPAETPQAEAALQGGPAAVEEGTAGEVAPHDPFKQTSLKNASVDADLKALGFEPILKPETRKQEAVMSEARQAYETDPGEASRIIAGVLARPKAISDGEGAMVLIELANRKIAQGKAQQAYLRLADNNASPEDLADARQVLDAARDATLDAARASKITGSEAGRTLAFRQRSIDDDYSLTAMETRFRIDALEGGKLDERQEKLIATMDKQIREADARPGIFEEAAEAEAAGDTEKADSLTELARLVDAHTTEQVREQKRLEARSRAPRRRAKIKEILDPKIAAAKARIAARNAAQVESLTDNTKLHSALGSPEFFADLKDYAIIYSAKFVDLAMELDQFRSEVIADLGDWIRPYTEALFHRSRAIYRENAASADGDEAPTREEVLDGVDPETPLDKRDVWALASTHIRAGLRGRNVLDAVFDDLSTKFPDLTRDKVAELYTNYGKVIFPSKNEATKELNRVRNLERIGLKLKDVLEGRMPKRTGFQRGEQDVEVRELEKQFRAALRESGLQVTDPEKQLQTSLGAIKRRMSNEIEEIELAIAKKQPRTTPDRKPLPEDAEVKELRAKLDQKRQEYDEVFKAKPDRLQQAKDSVQRSLDRYLEMLVKGDVSTSEKLKVEADEELKTLTSLRDTFAKQVHEARNPKPTEYELREKARTAAIESAEKTLAEVERRISERDLSIKPQGESKFADDPVLKQLREKITEGRKTLAELRQEARPKKAPQQVRVEAALKSLDRQIAEEEQLLRDGILKKTKAERLSTPEIEARRDKLREMREHRRELYAAQNPLNPLEQAKKAAIEAGGRLQKLIDSGDVAVKRKEQIQPDAELQALWDSNEALHDEIVEMRKALPLTDGEAKAAIEKALAASEKTAAKIQAKLDSGDLSVESKPLSQRAAVVGHDPGVQRVRAQIKALNKEMAARRRAALPKLSPEEARIRRVLQYAERAKKDLTRRIATRDVTPKGRPTPLNDLEVRKARRDVNTLKRKFNEIVIEEGLKNAPSLTKAARLAVDIPLRLPRAIMASLDVSGIGRQSWSVLLTRPGLAYKEFPKHFAFTEDAADRHESELENHPDFELAKSAGLALQSWRPGHALHEMEEAYRSRLAKKIPGVSHSERAYVTYLNGVRMSYFVEMAKLLRARPDGMTQASLKTLAAFVNNMTGRGKLGKYEKSMDLLSDVFFSPRYVSSRFRLLAGMAFNTATLGQGYRLGPKESRLARQIVSKEYTRLTVGASLLFGLLAFAASAFGGEGDDEKFSFSLDPLSSDFGKIKIGEMRIDVGGGMIQPLVFLSRFVTGKKHGADGVEIHLRGPLRERGQSLGRLATQFARSKFSPTAALLTDGAFETDLYGRPAYTSENLISMYVPLPVSEVYENYRKMGFGGATVAGMAGFVGLGSSAYGPQADENYQGSIGKDINTHLMFPIINTVARPFGKEVAPNLYETDPSDTEFLIDR